jgi:hypothetical protein
MNRFGAFAVHLAISLLIFAVLAYLVLYHWYPDFFFDTDGGWQGMRIIILVDLVLGPTLTLIVYKHGKPSLKSDLTLIGLFQTVCLIAGVYVVFSERPLALVYVDGHFFSMSRGDYENVEAPVPDLTQFPGPWPKRVMVRIPEDFVEQSKIRRQAIAENRPLRAFSRLYTGFDFTAANAEREALSRADVEQRDLQGDILPAWLREHGGAFGDYAFFPYAGRYSYYILGMSRADGRLVDVLPLSFVDLPAVPADGATTGDS